MRIQPLRIWYVLLCFSLIAFDMLPGTSAAEELSPEERTAGFVSLFDGKTLNGWTGATEG